MNLKVLDSMEPHIRRVMVGYLGVLLNEENPRLFYIRRDNARDDAIDMLERERVLVKVSTDEIDIGIIWSWYKLHSDVDIETLSVYVSLATDL